MFNRILIKSIQVIEIFIIGVLFITVSLYYKDGFVLGSQYEKSFLFFIFITALVIVNSLKRILNKSCFNIITILDLLIILYFLYITINHFFIGKIPSFTLQYYEIIALLFFYFVARSLSSLQILFLFTFLMVSGIIQSVYGILQLYNVYPSHHYLFKVTGGFFNPAPFAGYIASILPVAIIFYLQYEKESIKRFFSISLLKGIKINSESYIKRFDYSYLKETIKLVFIKYLSLLTILTVILVLPSTQSRAAWIAVLVSGSIVILNSENFYNNIRANFEIIKIRLTPFLKILFITIFIIIITGIIIGLYYIKPDSASGRFLIWKVTINMIADKPVFGHGNEKFAANYMEYQADYFIKNPGSKYIKVAGDNNYAFNDVLKLCSELGIIGLTITLLMFYFIFNDIFFRNSNIHKKASQYGFLSVLVFSLFSYPSEIIAIKINVVLFLAIISSNSFVINSIISKYNKFIQVIIVVILITTLILLKKPLTELKKSYEKFNEGYSLYQYGAYDECIRNYQEAYKYLKNNGTFMVAYGKGLSIAGKHEEAIKILNEAKDYLTNTILYTALGDSYKAVREYKKAEKAYLRAWDMVPDRFYPGYLLAKLYQETGQKKKAKEIANKIISKSPKIPSQAVEEIKFEMRKIIESE